MKLLEAGGYIVQSTDVELSILDGAKPKYIPWILLIIFGLLLLPMMKIDSSIIIISPPFILYSIYELLKEKKKMHRLIITKVDKKVYLKFKFDTNWTSLDFKNIEGIETSELDIYNEPNPFSNKAIVKYCKIKLMKKNGNRVNLFSQKLNKKTQPLIKGLVSDVYSYFL
ncbi:MAG: hypothetical protein O2887_04310 [Bacteroidetes bacterium]|nr:hypothetical protein [Bacteroidota bacterium]MDA1119708.1 hypothetical protein [Bacteroidota bacterium]